MSQEARTAALNLLARREHSVFEMRQKLRARGFEVDDVQSVLATLTAEGLLSDDRFSEAFVNYRMARGLGPTRIAAELQQRGIDAQVIAEYLDARDTHWLQRAQAVRVKRFGNALPVDYKERMRQARFLQYRGFTSEQIWSVLGDDPAE